MNSKDEVVRVSRRISLELENIKHAILTKEGIRVPKKNIVEMAVDCLLTQDECRKKFYEELKKLSKKNRKNQ